MFDRRAFILFRTRKIYFQTWRSCWLAGDCRLERAAAGEAWMATTSGQAGRNLCVRSAVGLAGLDFQLRNVKRALGGSAGSCWPCVGGSRVRTTAPAKDSGGRRHVLWHFKRVGWWYGSGGHEREDRRLVLASRTGARCTPVWSGREGGLVEPGTKQLRLRSSSPRRDATTNANTSTCYELHGAGGAQWE